MEREEEAQGLVSPTPLPFRPLTQEQIGKMRERAETYAKMLTEKRQEAEEVSPKKPCCKSNIYVIGGVVIAAFAGYYIYSRFLSNGALPVNGAAECGDCASASGAI